MSYSNNNGLHGANRCLQPAKCMIWLDGNEEGFCYMEEAETREISRVPLTQLSIQATGSWTQVTCATWSRWLAKTTHPATV